MTSKIPTIRELEFQKLENVNKTKKEMKEWNIYKYPTLTKRVPSISKLRKKIADFFAENEVDEVTPITEYPSISQLALYLGYPSQKKMLYDINNPTEQAYSDELARAVDLIQDMLQRKQMEVAVAGRDYKGIASVIDRQDKISASVSLDDKTNVKLAISIEAKAKIDNLIADGIASIFKKSEAVETTFEEVVEDDEL